MKTPSPTNRPASFHIPLKPLDRRTFLRGVGAMMALPWLEAMTPLSAATAAAQPTRIPRMAMFYFGTGMNMRQFYPEGFGPQAKLSRILAPLEKHRGAFTVLSGTWLEDGGGHDGAYPFSTAVPRGEAQTISPDQIAAEIHGRQTRFPSLQMSVKRGTGYGSQALATLSWNRQGVPLAAENDPKALFKKLFEAPDPSQHAERGDEFRQRRSVLDVVLADAKRLRGSLSANDKDQLDQYLHSVREVEKGLEREIEWSERPKPKPDMDHYGNYHEAISPEGNGKFYYDDYAKLMYDLIALAFQTDSTRVITYVVRTELAGGVYPEFGVSKGYHELSHHGNDPKNLEELAKVDTIYMKHWAYFLDRLASIKDGSGSLLDHTMLGFSSGMGIGHSKTRLPTVLSGGSGLGINHQTHLQLPDKTPLSALWHTMVAKMGVDTGDSFQDSPGTLQQIG
jgi:hypothetical protein